MPFNIKKSVKATVSRLIMPGKDRTYISDPIPIGQEEKKDMGAAQAELGEKGKGLEANILSNTSRYDKAKKQVDALDELPSSACLHKTFTVRDSDVRAVYEVVCTDLCGQVLGVVPTLIKVGGPAGRFEEEIVRIVEGVRGAARAELDLDKREKENFVVSDPVYSWVDGDDDSSPDPTDDSGIDPASVASAVMPMSFATVASIDIYDGLLPSDISRTDLQGEIDRLKAEKEKLERKLRTRVVSRVLADKGERAIDF